MKVIKINEKKFEVSASQERAMRILADNDFTALKSEFAEGGGRHRRSILPDSRYARENFSIEIEYNGECASRFHSNRVKRFFRQHPRAQYCVTGNPRRIKTILAKL